jgi:hypothetical protein
LTVYNRGGDTTSLTCTQTLDGQNVLPGFTLSLAKLFAELDRRPPDADPAL